MYITDYFDVQLFIEHLLCYQLLVLQQRTRQIGEGPCIHKAHVLDENVRKYMSKQRSEKTRTEKVTQRKSLG